MAVVLSPDPDSFEPLPPQRVGMFGPPGPFARSHFPAYVGLELVDVRLDYARMRLPFRRELNQPVGVVHGGAIATLIDTVVVPAVGSAYDRMPLMLTLSLSIQFLSAVKGEDMMAEGWVTKRGRSIAFSSAVVRTASGQPVATGELVYSVKPT